MVINLEELFSNLKDEIEINEDVVFQGDDYKIPEIIDLKNVHVKGQISIDENDEIVLNGILSGVMTISDSISLDDVDYNFEAELDENLEEMLEKNQNTIDILDILWQNIVLEVPLRYTLVDDYSKYSGDGWKLISEDELSFEHNPFKALIENEKRSD